MPGSDSSWREICSRSLPASITMSPAASCSQALISALARAAGIAKSPVVHAGDCLGGRERVGDAFDRNRERFADGGNQPRGQRARTLDRHLLAEHRTGEQLDTVGMPRRAQPRTLADQSRQDRIVGKVGLDGVGIGVEVEHSTASLHRGLRIRDVVEVQRAHHRVRSRPARSW